jgi:rhamnogalacturonyl hydrolase YesR
MRGLCVALLFALPLTAAELRYVGLTPSGARIEARLVPEGPQCCRVLLIGGLNGADETSRVVSAELRDFEATPRSRRAFRLIAIPVANPDRSKLQFPPLGVAYRENAESHALWRWIAMQGVDQVLIVGENDFGLAQALSENGVSGLGRIPARRVAAKPGVLQSLRTKITPSEVNQELYRRRSRTARQFAEQLALVYGKDFDQPAYIPGMALIGQLRLRRYAQVEKLAEPYASGARDSLGSRPSSLVLAGHLVFAELAERTRDPRYLALVRRAADLGFTPAGEMKESMPFHDEMSDSVFMGTAILARAGKLTGERKYFDMAARHLEFMDKLVLRPDGLYRHSPLTDAAWGRGNAFPALGLALVLSDFPKDHPARLRIAVSFGRLMTAFAKFQDADGLWRQVIDEPASYAETSATAMIGFAMQRGIRRGWLDLAYQRRVDRAWRAVLSRVSQDGVILDVCESTNKQRTLKDYLNRAAIFDRDARGGGMALLFATEMANLQ